MEDKRKEQFRALERLKILERITNKTIKLDPKKERLNLSQITPIEWSTSSTNHTPELEFNPNKVINNCLRLISIDTIVEIRDRNKI